MQSILKPEQDLYSGQMEIRTARNMTKNQDKSGHIEQFSTINSQRSDKIGTKSEHI